MLRGVESAEHVYLQRLIQEICLSHGALSALEARLPEGGIVDVVAIKNKEVFYFEVTTRLQQRNWNKKGAKTVHFVLYRRNSLPSREEVAKIVVNALNGFKPIDKRSRYLYHYIKAPQVMLYDKQSKV